MNEHNMLDWVAAVGSNTGEMCRGGAASPRTAVQI